MSIAVLGPLTVDGETGRLGPRDRVVLAALAIRPGEVVRAERIAEALWGESPPETWAKVVQGCVMRLRKALGPAAIETVEQGYRLVLPADDVDSVRFDRLLRRGRELLDLGEPERAAFVLGEASELWRGRPLTDLDRWHDGRVEAARLDELRLDLDELRLDAALRAGRSSEVLSRARALVGESPLREHRWALLALAQYQVGRQAESLRTLREVRTVLATELGLDPGPELAALEQAILRQDPDLLAEGPLADPSPACPYQGLLPYAVEDGDRFFGRGTTVAACLRRLAEAGVLVVVGPSGSGKSSLVRAGVAAAVRGQGRRPVVITPGAHPMDVLRGLSRRPGDVLVVDQCEEAFSQCADARERARFFQALAEHAERNPLVVALRADRTGEIPGHPQFASVVERGLFLLGPLALEDLRACIQGPAQQAGLLLEPGLVDLLVREVEGTPGALPLLSHALRQTWGHREGRTMTVAGYVATGGIKGAVARTAEELYDSLEPEQQTVLRDLLLRLVAMSGEGDAGPDRAPNGIPSRMVGDDEQHQAIVELLVAARLVTSDDGVLELAHESLARNWPRLRGWLEDDVEGQRIRRHLTAAADAWDSMGRPAEEVYRGVRLAQALDWRERGRPLLTPVERAFLDDSRSQVDAELNAAKEHADRETRAGRRTRRFAVGLAGVLVLALLAAATAIGFQRTARDRAADAAAASTTADANRIATQAGSVGALDLSLLLAAEAARLADTPATRAGLLGSLVQHRRATRVAGLGDRPTDGELADSGQALFVAVQNGVLFLPSGSTAKPRKVVDWYAPEDLAGSPTNDLVAVKSVFDGNLKVGVFAADGTRRLLLRGAEQIGGWPVSVGFSPDGRRLRILATAPARTGAGYLGTIREVAVGTGRVTRTLPVQRSFDDETFVMGAFSDDGTAVVSWRHRGLPGAIRMDLDSGARTRLRTPLRSVALHSFEALPGGTSAQTWADGIVTLYDARGRRTQELGVHRSPVDDMVIAPGRTWAASVDNRGEVVVWDVDRRTGAWSQRERLEGHDGAVTGAAVDNSGGTLVTVSQDATSISWDLSPAAGFGSRVAGLGDQWAANRPQTVVPGRLVVLPARPAARTFTDFEQGRDVEAVFLDPRTGRVVDRVPVGRTLAGVSQGSSVAVSPDATRVAVTYGLGTVVLDTRTREELGRIVLDDAEVLGEQQPEPVWSSAWSSDGARLLLAADGDTTDPQDGGLAEVDTASWTLRDDRIDLGGAAQTLETSPGGRWVAVGVSMAAVDGAPAATVQLLDARTYQPEWVLRLDEGEFPFDLSFSPDGRRLAFGGDPGTVSVVDVASGRRLHDPVQLHNDFVQQVEWLDDATLMTSGRDGMVTLFDADLGLVRARMPGASDGRAGYTFLTSVTTDEVTAVSGAGDGRRYSLRLDAWLDYACLVAGRDLSRDEWSAYLPAHAYRPGCGDRTRRP